MYICLAIITTAAFRFLLKAENARRDRGERDEIIEGSSEKVGGGIRVGVNVGPGGDEKNGRYSSVDEARREKGDLWSGYRYTL